MVQYLQQINTAGGFTVMRKLTKRQEDVMVALRKYYSDNGMPPTVRELGAQLGLASSCTVQRHLDALIKKGYINRDPSKARTVSIVKGNQPISKKTPDRGIINVPILGTVTAGIPILAHEQYDETIPLPRTLVPEDDCFILRVSGDSMINAGLYDGDMAVIKRQEYANNGEVVVALIEDEATIKRFFKMRGKIKLQAENPAYKPIIVKECRILGKVVMSIHHF